MLILASKSPRRKEILEGLGLEFRCESPEVDESHPFFYIIIKRCHFMDHETIQMIISAQNAGGGQAAIYSLLSPAVVAASFCVVLIIIIMIIGGILDHFTEKPDQNIPIWEEFPKEEEKRSNKK